MKLLIVGSVAYDTVESAAGKVECALGGAATYASVAASCYCKPCIVAVVGEDFQNCHLELLRSRGIDLCGLQQKPGRTFHWAGRYLADMIGRETLATELNVFETFDPVLPPNLVDADHIFLANIHPALQRRVLDQVKKPKLVICDTMNLWINTARAELEALLPRVDYLVVNDEEIRLLTGDYNILRGAKKVMALTRQGVIVKRGEHGSTLFCREGMAIAPAYPVEELVDPTGAGDSFAGALIGYLATAPNHGLAEMKRALMHGAAMASFTVEGFSLDAISELSRMDIENRVATLRALTVFE
ncbi:MAG: PfkB family carbohydrate kinase [Chromatiales bacterium]|nr:PfkB family carbohydrate kinase [Chromatiales bacterium]